MLLEEIPRGSEIDGREGTLNCECHGIVRLKILQDLRILAKVVHVLFDEGCDIGNLRNRVELSL